MDDEARPDEFDEREAAEPFNDNPADEQCSWLDAPSAQESAASFCDQILRGCWPIRMPMALEIYAEGSLPQVHPLEHGRGRHRPDSHIITIVLEYDRARVREMMLERIRSPHGPEDSMLIDLIGLVRVDRQCFLETAAQHFAETLSQTDAPLRTDRCLYGFVRDLHEFDGEVIGDLVAETMRRDRTAAARLRNVILDLVDHPEAREHLGWLAAAAITDRLQEL
jgi:hypothetical protein